MKKLFFSPNLALLLILALILPPQSAMLYPPPRDAVRPELSRRTLRPSNAGMEESQVRGQLENALNPAAGLEEGKIPGQGRSANDDQEVIERAISRLQGMRDIFIATPAVIRILREFLVGRLSIEQALERIDREAPPGSSSRQHRITLKTIWLMAEFDLTPQGALIAYGVATQPQEQVIDQLIRHERPHRSRINRPIAKEAVEHAARLNPLFNADPAAGLEEKFWINDNKASADALARAMERIPGFFELKPRERRKTAKHILDIRRQGVFQSAEDFAQLILASSEKKRKSLGLSPDRIQSLARSLDYRLPSGLDRRALLARTAAGLAAVVLGVSAPLAWHRWGPVTIPLEFVEGGYLTAVLGELLRDSDHPDIRSEQATLLMTVALLKAKPAFITDQRTLTVLYPGSGSHVTPLEIATLLISQKRIDSAQYIFTEIDEQKLSDLERHLLLLKRAGFFDSVSKSEQPFDEGKEVVFRVEFQGKPITLLFALRRSGNRFWRPEYLQKANLIYSHDASTGDQKFYDQLLEDFYGDGKERGPLFLMGEDQRNHGLFAKSVFPSGVKKEEFGQFSPDLLGKVTSVPFGYGHRSVLPREEDLGQDKQNHDERGDYSYPNAHLVEFDGSFLRSLSGLKHQPYKALTDLSAVSAGRPVAFDYFIYSAFRFSDLKQWEKSLQQSVEEMMEGPLADQPERRAYLLLALYSIHWSVYMGAMAHSRLNLQDEFIPYFRQEPEGRWLEKHLVPVMKFVPRWVGSPREPSGAQSKWMSDLAEFLMMAVRGVPDDQLDWNSGIRDWVYINTLRFQMEQITVFAKTPEILLKELESDPTVVFEIIREMGRFGFGRSLEGMQKAIEKLPDHPAVPQNQQEPLRREVQRALEKIRAIEQEDSQRKSSAAGPATDPRRAGLEEPGDPVRLELGRAVQALASISSGNSQIWQQDQIPVNRAETVPAGVFSRQADETGSPAHNPPLLSLKAGGPGQLPLHLIPLGPRDRAAVPVSSRAEDGQPFVFGSYNHTTCLCLLGKGVNGEGQEVLLQWHVYRRSPHSFIDGYRQMRPELLSEDEDPKRYHPEKAVEQLLTEVPRWLADQGDPLHDIELLISPQTDVADKMDAAALQKAWQSSGVKSVLVVPRAMGERWPNGVYASSVVSEAGIGLFIEATAFQRAAGPSFEARERALETDLKALDQAAERFHVIPWGFPTGKIPALQIPAELANVPATAPRSGLEEPIKSSLEIYGNPLGGPDWLKPADLRFPEIGGKRPISDEVLFKAIGRLPDVLRDHYISDSSNPGLAYYRYEVSPSSVLPGGQGFNAAQYLVLNVREQSTGRSFVISEIQLPDIPRGSPLSLKDLWDMHFLPSKYFGMMKKVGIPVDRDIGPIVGKFSDRETVIRQKRGSLPFVIFGELGILHEVGGILWTALLSADLKDRWRQIYPFKNNPEEGPIYLRSRLSASAHASQKKNPEKEFYDDAFSDKFSVFILEQATPVLAEVGWVLRPEERAYFNDVIAYFEDKVARGFKVNEIEPTPAAGLEEKGTPAAGLAALTTYVAQPVVADTIRLLAESGKTGDVTSDFPELVRLAREAGFKGSAEILKTAASGEAMVTMPVEFAAQRIPVFVQNQWLDQVKESLGKLEAENIIRFEPNPEKAFMVIGDESLFVRPSQMAIRINGQTVSQVTPHLLQELQRMDLLKAGSVVMLYQASKDSALIFA